MSPFLMSPAMLSLLLYFGFLRSVSPFSFVSIRDGHTRQSRLRQQSPVTTRRPMPTPTAKFSILRRDQCEDGESDFEYQSDASRCEKEASVESSPMQSRRRMISLIAAGVLSSGIVTRHIKHAFATNANAEMIGTPVAIGTADHPVVIVGGGGRSGMAVAEAVADESFGNMHAVTLSRTGKDPFKIIKLPSAIQNNLRHFNESFDVRESQETISTTLRSLSPSVVVYAASASRQGGTAFEIDDIGVEKVALACKEVGAIFVLISALAVDRPDSKSYQITNTLGGNYQGIMDAKLNGEVKTRKIFSSGKSDYVIVRSGVLLNGKTTQGPIGLELNQADTIGGGLSRDELAGVVVGAIQNRALALATKSKKGGEGITVEVYRKSTAQKLEKKYPIPSGNELTVDTLRAITFSSQTDLYRELFTGAKLD